MYDLATRKRALALVAQGRSLRSVSLETGISRSALRQWAVRLEPAYPRRECPRCSPTGGLDTASDSYSYLLGLYLGDGYITTPPRRTPGLSLACGNDWPGLIDAAADAVASVFPGNRVGRTPGEGCTYVRVHSLHIPCLFPQHGPGMKHERHIALRDWQQALVATHPWDFLRGLVHSDGCRITNWTTRQVAGATKRYTYPRYLFTNKSTDIVGLFTATLDRTGVRWSITRRRQGTWTVSVARRDSVALMDLHIGPKW